MVAAGITHEKHKRGRYMFRGEFDGAVDRLRERLQSSEGRGKLRLRRLLAEHPFGTMKRAFNQGYVLLKGLRKVGERLDLRC